MKNYRVIFHLIKSVDYEVKAENEEKAEEIASERFSKEYQEEEMDIDDILVEEVK